MRRPLRNIEIFSMSVLDMFASALGAFIIVSVLLFPYFNQTKILEKTQHNIEETIDKISKLQTELRIDQDTSRRQQEEIRQSGEWRTALVACQQAMEACRVARTKVFLVVIMEWNEPCDVDLYVTDPANRQFYYSRKTNPPSEGELSIDMLYGPGIEVWQNPKAERGIYQIEYKKGGNCPALSADEDFIVVKGSVLDRGAGLQKINDRKLTMHQTAVKAGSVTVSDDGVATVQN
jgi:hypothetical protein